MLNEIFGYVPAAWILDRVAIREYHVVEVRVHAYAEYLLKHGRLFIHDFHATGLAGSAGGTGDGL